MSARLNAIIAVIALATAACNPQQQPTASSVPAATALPVSEDTIAAFRRGEPLPGFRSTTLRQWANVGSTTSRFVVTPPGCSVMITNDSVRTDHITIPALGTILLGENCAGQRAGGHPIHTVRGLSILPDGTTNLEINLGDGRTQRVLMARNREVIATVTN